MPLTANRRLRSRLEPGSFWSTWLGPLTGPNAMTVPGCLIACAAIMFGIAGTAPGGDARALATTELIGLGSCAITAALWIVASWTYMRVLHGMPRAWAAIATFGAVGALRSLWQDTMLAQVGIADAPDFALLIPFTMVTTILWSVVGALIVDAWRDGRTANALLLREQRRHAFCRDEAEGMIVTGNRMILQELDARLHAELALAGMGDVDRQTMARRLRQIAQVVVRPVSRVLTDHPTATELLDQLDATPVEASRSWRARIDDLTDNAFLPLYTTVLVGVITFIETTEVVGTAWSVPVVLAGLLALILAIIAARTVAAPALASASTVPRLVAIIVLWALIGAIDFAGRATFIIAAQIPFSTQQHFLFVKIVSVDALIMFSVALAVSVVSRVNERTAMLVQEIADTQHAIGRLQQVAWADQRRLAAFVHGDVQSRLIAAAIRLMSESDADTDAILDELARDLDARFASLLEADPWRDALADIVEMWRGSVTVGIDVSPQAADALDSDATAAYATTEVVRELINNGVQHGFATRFAITIARNGSHLVLALASDGTIDAPLAGGSTPSLAAALIRQPDAQVPNVVRLPEPDAAMLMRGGGLGLRLLDEACLTWWIRPVPSGSRAGALIPLDVEGPTTPLVSTITSSAEPADADRSMSANWPSGGLLRRGMEQTALQRSTARPQRLPLQTKVRCP